MKATPGWYPDPDHEDDYWRWWDGTDWTTDRRSRKRWEADELAPPRTGPWREPPVFRNPT